MEKQTTDHKYKVTIKINTAKSLKYSQHSVLTGAWGCQALPQEDEQA